ncbi:MAG TPA: hypothetical protein VMD79_14830 [Solirubrobacteraceae bacterium]|nr:hypothetical protein [Solirubrobacteraceae bacterium]
MSTRSPGVLGPAGLGHPVVLDRRMRDWLALALAGVIPAAVALGVTVAFPQANVLVFIAIIVGAIAVVALINSSRLEVTVTILAIYLLLLDGPVKLGIGSHEATAAVPDVLIGAVSLGALLRLAVRRERVQMPPLSAWVLAFIGTVVIEAFNPQTASILKVLAGFRQELQWVPFFFFGYVLLRSKSRLRILFVIVGVCAAANAVVSTYQTALSPAQLAGWGPGYRALYQPTTIGKAAGHARVYDSEGEARARPVGLGSDSGFSGGVGMLGLTFSLGLLAIWKRRRWVPVVIALASMAGIITGLGRLQVVGALLSVVFFILFAALAGRQGRRAVAALLTVVLVAIPVGVGFLTVVRSGTFKRYESFENSSASELATHKAGAYTLIPHELETLPFGVGLGTVGSIGGVGGRVTDLLEGHTVSAETQYNLLADELGAPGLLLWSVLSVFIVVVVARGLRTVRDPDLAILLSAACAPFAAMIITGFSGPFQTSSALGPYFWLTVGIVAYWFAGPGRSRRVIVASAPQANLVTA